MIKKVRTRFLLMILIAICVILSIIVTMINLVNYHNITASADDIIDILELNNGAFGEIPDFEEDPDITLETPYETRFFTVEFFNDGSHWINIKQIAAVDEEAAIQMSLIIIENGESRGYFEEYRYKMVLKEESTFLIFVDWSRQLNVVSRFVNVSIIISIISLAVIFLVTIIAFKRAITPIEMAYEKQSRFIANASHEIKTPLTIISANAELIEIENGECENTMAIYKQINKLNQMVNSLTILAKMDSLNGSKQKESFDISNLLKDTLADYKSVLERFTINVEIQDDIHYKGNKGLIQQLFCILLDNAGKYGLSEIDIKLARNGLKIDITISNDVHHIEQGDLSKYFERFYRSSDARSTTIEGSGIGLSIGSDIVEFHSGTIKAMGKDNKFIIKILL